MDLLTQEELLAVERASAIQPQADLRDEDKVNRSNFELIRVLGTGAYGVVYLVQKKGGKDDGNLYAMKVLEKKDRLQTVETAQQMKWEREVLETFRGSQYLVQLHYAFQTESKLYVVLDYIPGGELLMLLNMRHKAFSEEEVRIYIGEIILAIEKLHSKGFIYRDLKLENLLLAADGHIVVTDLGAAKDLSKEPNGRAYSYCGTIEYMAPEVIKHNGKGYDFSADLWSIGVLCYEMLTGVSPFMVDEDQPQRNRTTAKQILGMNPDMAWIFSDDARDFIRRLLNKDPSKRLGSGPTGIDAIKAHKFFNGIDWAKLANKEMDAPYQPIVEHPLDTRNFDQEFTKRPAIEEHVEPPRNHERFFRGWSYVAPEHQKEPNNNTAKLDRRPSVHEVIEHSSKSDSFFKRYSFVEDEPLGEGTFSICMKCVDNDTNKEYAVKIMRSSYNTEAEVEALTKCKGHANIVSFVEIIKDDAFTYIITEWLAGKELFEFVHTHTVSESEARKIFKTVVDAVAHIHAQNIVHRDLKLENIKFADESNYLSNSKVLDFGFACKVSKDDNYVEGLCYTLDYVAPEVLSHANYTKACDMWSMGVILYRLLCGGHSPFFRQNENSFETPTEKIIDHIQQGLIDENGAWEMLSEPAKDLIRRLLTVSPQSRITLNEVLAHDWLSLINGDCAGPVILGEAILSTTEIIDENVMLVEIDELPTAAKDKVKENQKTAKKRMKSKKKTDRDHALAKSKRNASVAFYELFSTENSQIYYMCDGDADDSIAPFVQERRRPKRQRKC